MRSSGDRLALGLIILTALVHLVPAQDEVIMMPIEDLRLPLERHANGQTKTQLTAGRALVPSSGEGDIKAENIGVEVFDETGASIGVMTAESGVYSRQEQTAVSTGRVEVAREGVVVTGKGMIWKGLEETVKVTSDVRVVIDSSNRKEVPYAR